MWGRQGQAQEVDGPDGHAGARAAAGVLGRQDRRCRRLSVHAGSPAATCVPKESLPLDCDVLAIPECSLLLSRGSTGHGVAPCGLVPAPLYVHICLLAPTDLYKLCPPLFVCSAAVCPAYPEGCRACGRGGHAMAAATTLHWMWRASYDWLCYWYAVCEDRALRDASRVFLGL